MQNIMFKLLLVSIICAVTILIFGCDLDDVSIKDPSISEEISESGLISKETNAKIESEQEIKVVVNVYELRLRSGPSEDHRVGDTLIRGTILMVLGKHNEWLLVKAPNGRGGWVHDDNVVSEKTFAERKNIYPPIVETYDAFNINLPEDIFSNSNQTISNDLELKRYPVYTINNISPNYYHMVHNFVWAMMSEEIASKQNPIGLNAYEWEVSDGYVEYNGHHLVIRIEIETPVIIPNIVINPESKDSITEGLGKIYNNYFHIKLDHRVDEITKDGNYYKIKYSRLLDGLPYYNISYPLYLILSSDGRLKEGQFFLREFEQIGEVQLISEVEFAENLNLTDYPKSVSFAVPSDEYTDHLMIDGYHSHHYPLSLPIDKGAGVIYIEKAELVYYHRNFHEVDGYKDLVLPMLYLEGEGFVNPEVLFIGDEETREAKFKVLANAISLKHLVGYYP